MGNKAGQQSETSAQKAQAAHAVQQLQDYKQRWEPVQAQLASTIEQEGKTGSAARKLATGKASTDTAMEFDKAKTQLNAGLSNSGVAPGSGRAVTATAGMGADAAGSKGLNEMMSDEAVTDAYTQGLGALTSLGRGQSAQVGQNLTTEAQNSGMQASADANASLMNYEGAAGVAGQVAGFGIQRASKSNFGISPSPAVSGGLGSMSAPTLGTEELSNTGSPLT
jgi:hypothetical protein